MQPDVQGPRLADRASNLELGGDGVWFARGDFDRNFAENEETRWKVIEDGSFWYRHRNGVILDLLRRFPYTGWLFEIGAGNGAVSAAIQANGLPVVAMEPTVAWAKHARLRGLRYVICAHFEKAGFALGTLDNIGLFDVLEHIEEDHAFLCDLRRLMPAGGLLYLAVPACQGLWSTEDEASGHHRRYRRGPLTALIETAGFRVEHTTYFFLPLVPAIWVARSLPSKLGITTKRTHASSSKQHGLDDGPAVKLMRWVLHLERATLRKGLRMPIGSSLIAVARAV